MINKIKSFINIISPLKQKIYYNDRTLKMIELYDYISKNYYQIFDGIDIFEQEIMSTHIDNFTQLFESSTFKEDRNDFLYYLRLKNQETQFLDIFPDYKHIVVASFLYFGIKEPKLNKKSTLKIS